MKVAESAPRCGMTVVHVAPPINACDALGWFRYACHLKDNWQCPGGLDYEKFSSEFVLAVVPDGWIKPGYGPTAQGKQRKDIGKGHVAFLDLYTAGVFDSLVEARARKDKEIRFDRAVVDHFFRVSIGAIESWGYVSAIDSNGRTIWIVDAHRDDGKRFVMHADEKPWRF
jgi:hypothetical protein